MSEWTLIFYQKKRGGGGTDAGIMMPTVVFTGEYMEFFDA